MTTETKGIAKSHLDKSIDYTAYRTIIDNLLAEGKSTGPNQSEALTDYSKMNVQRMKRWDKTFAIDEDVQKVLAQVTRPMIWVVIAEGWCGDAAQNLPGLVKMAHQNDAIEVRILFRDEHLDLMDQYLTNGGRSIPKLIAIDANTHEELFTWGPRPQAAQEIFLDLKSKGLPYAEELHKWYARDKGHSLQQEFKTLLSDLVG